MAPARRAAKTPKTRKPQDLTDYSLRGIERRLAELEARVKALEGPREVQGREPEPVEWVHEKPEPED